MGQKIISLENVKDGKIEEQLQKAFSAIISDIKNEEKDAQSVRAVTLKIKFAPTVDRLGAQITAHVQTTLGGNNQIGAMLFFQKKGNAIVAHDEDPKQGKLIK